jgi:hypothetical protein
MQENHSFHCWLSWIGQMKPYLAVTLTFALIICGGISCSRKCAPCPPISLPSGIPKNQYIRIDFERFDREKGIVWLRLTNWTAWAVRIPVEMFPYPTGNISLDIVKSAKTHKDGAEATVRYYLQEYDPRPWGQITYSDGRKSPPDEPEHPPVPKINRFDFSTEWWVPKEQSIVFQVPKNHVARNVSLYVNVRYEWESLGTEVLTGPVHSVFFRGIELPKDVQAQIK